MISLRKTLDMIGCQYRLPFNIGSITEERPLSLNALLETLCLMNWTPPPSPSSSLPPMPPPDEAGDPEKLYISLKQIEDKFPFPTPTATVYGGILFPTGAPYDYLNPNPSRSDPIVYIICEDYFIVDAVNIAMDFSVDEFEAPEVNASVVGVSSTVGESVPIPFLPPRFVIGDKILLNIGGRTYPRNFDIAIRFCYKGEVFATQVYKFRRPLLLGIGVYTLPVVPVAVVYEPPQDLNNKNTVTYTEVKSVGTTIQTSISTEDSKTIAAPVKFDDVNGTASTLQTIGTAMVTAAPKLGKAAPYVAGMGLVVAALGAGLGSHTATQTDGTKVQNDHTVTIECSDTDIIRPTLHKGPGRGDCIICRTNVRVAWMADPDGGITLYVLPGSRLTVFTLDLLLSGPQKTGLDPETVQALVNLDPFAVDTPDADLPAPRFCKEKSWQINFGADIEYQASHEITEEDMTTSVSFTTHAEDQSPGWLSFLRIGIGITEEKHTRHTLTHSGSRSVKIGDRVTTEVSFFADVPAQEMYCIDSYYDRVFGTFAFKRVPLQTSPAISGQVSDASGQPAAFQIVTLRIAGREYSTDTDQQGSYAFRAAHIPAGAGSLTIGDTTQKVERQEGVSLKCDLVLTNSP